MRRYAPPQGYLRRVHPSFYHTVILESGKEFAVARATFVVRSHASRADPRRSKRGARRNGRRRQGHNCPYPGKCYASGKEQPSGPFSPGEFFGKYLFYFFVGRFFFKNVYYDRLSVRRYEHPVLYGHIFVRRYF